MAVLDIIGMEYPQMAALPNVALWIARAEGRTNRPYFSSSPSAPDEAVAYRAMHMYALSPAAGGRPMSEAGTIASKTEGGLSISFGQLANSKYTNDSLDQTAYGKQLKELIRIQTPAIGVTSAGVTINTPLPPETQQADQIANDFFNNSNAGGLVQD